MSYTPSHLPEKLIFEFKYKEDIYKLIRTNKLKKDYVDAIYCCIKINDNPTPIATISFFKIMLLSKEFQYSFRLESTEKDFARVADLEYTFDCIKKKLPTAIKDFLNFYKKTHYKK